MPDKPLSSPLPADLPEDWALNQVISPNGTEAGLDQKHGYNYQSKQINAAQKGVNAINQAMGTKADVDAVTGKVKSEQMPPYQAPLKDCAAKEGVADADSVALVDSADNNKTKRVLWSKVKTTLKDWFDTLYAAAGHTHTAVQVGAIPTSQKGTAGGVAELDSGGKVPAAQLPSYVDDVLEYANRVNFPSVGESGKIYVALDTNLTWRWSGSGYVEISPSLALGETSGTAYRGDRGKAAYDHSQATGNAHGLTLAQLGAAPSTHTHPVSEVTGALKQFGPVSVTIPLAGWSGAGPWTQNVAVSGVLAAWDWKLRLSLQKITNDDSRKAQEKALGCITWCETYNGGITLTCRDKKPEVAISAVLSGAV